MLRKASKKDTNSRRHLQAEDKKLAAKAVSKDDAYAMLLVRAREAKQESEKRQAATLAAAAEALSAKPWTATAALEVGDHDLTTYTAGKTTGAMRTINRQVLQAREAKKLRAIREETELYAVAGGANGSAREGVDAGRWQELGMCINAICNQLWLSDAAYVGSVKLVAMTLVPYALSALLHVRRTDGGAVSRHALNQVAGAAAVFCAAPLVAHGTVFVSVGISRVVQTAGIRDHPGLFNVARDAVVGSSVWKGRAKEAYGNEVALSDRWAWMERDLMFQAKSAASRLDLQGMERAIRNRTIALAKQARGCLYQTCDDIFRSDTTWEVAHAAMLTLTAARMVRSTLRKGAPAEKRDDATGCDIDMLAMIDEVVSVDDDLLRHLGRMHARLQHDLSSVAPAAPAPAPNLN